MLWQIIKEYWKSRKEDCVIIINPKHKDIFAFNTEKVHVEIKAKRIPSGSIIQEIDYVGNSIVKTGVYNDGPKIGGLKPDYIVFDELQLTREQKELLEGVSRITIIQKARHIGKRLFTWKKENYELKD